MLLIMHLNSIFYYFSMNTVIMSNLTNLKITSLNITQNNYMIQPVGEELERAFNNH